MAAAASALRGRISPGGDSGRTARGSSLCPWADTLPSAIRHPMFTQSAGRGLVYQFVSQYSKLIHILAGNVGYYGGWTFSRLG